jgi:hypothetical protein
MGFAGLIKVSQWVHFSVKLLTKELHYNNCWLGKLKRTSSNAPPAPILLSE